MFLGLFKVTLIIFLNTWLQSARRKPEVQKKLDGLQFEYGNAFEEGNNEFAANFLSKYSRTLGGTNSAEDKGLIEEDRIVRPENLSQIATQPAASGNAIQDPNVAGKFPSQEVNV